MLGMFSRPKEVSNVEASDFRELLGSDKPVVLLDVRSRREFDSLHIPGAKLADIQSPGFWEHVQDIPKESHVLVYCRSGRRSMAACRKLASKGYKHLYNLKEGIVKWPYETQNSNAS